MMLRFLLCLIPGIALAEVQQGSPNADFAPAFAAQTRAAALPETRVNVSVFAQGLARPWGIASLGNGQYLVTERSGGMRVVPKGCVSAPIAGLLDVWARGQGGMLDVAVSPQFTRDRYVFWTYAKPVRGGAVAVAGRGTLNADGTIADARDIFVQTPASNAGQHFGSRIVPMPDGTVWITTGNRGAGDAGTLVQDDSTTHGKVIRVDYDGSNIVIWSKGHRNIQGAAILTGELLTVEHGPRGGDELNRPVRDGNYGWPLVSYGVNYNGRQIGAGRASIGSLNPGGLVRLELSAGCVVGEERMLRDVGRVRDLVQAEDSALLVIVDSSEVLRVVLQ